ncbi:MAG: hypothetical protein M0R80_01920 [Proteobacteria bacterium]|jgi:hypothetical protein|nr:hypothetical protein [Pseudomonadota bacterium]
MEPYWPKINELREKIARNIRHVRNEELSPRAAIEHILEAIELVQEEIGMLESEWPSEHEFNYDDG